MEVKQGHLGEFDADTVDGQHAYNFAESVHGHNVKDIVGIEEMLEKQSTKIININTNTDWHEIKTKDYSIEYKVSKFNNVDIVVNIPVDFTEYVEGDIVKYVLDVPEFPKELNATNIYPTVAHCANLNSIGKVWLIDNILWLKVVCPKSGLKSANYEGCISYSL